MKLWNHIKEKMHEKADQTVSENGTEMTYEELSIFAEIFARKLDGEKCCVILCESEMAAGMAVLGCFAAEVTAVPVSLRYGEVHCKKIINTVSPSSIITDINGELQVVRLSEYCYKEPETHPALIMFTSGTTGTPKGIMLSEDNILTNVKDISTYLNIGKDDRILISRPLYHCAVLTGEYIVSLCKGVSIVFCSEKFNPGLYLDLVFKNGITVFGGTPTLVGLMAKFKRKDKKCSLKTICVSGECMEKSVGKQIEDAFPEANIYHVYGLTEACPRVSYLPPQYFSDHCDCVGIPLDSVSVKIIKDDGGTAKNGEIGILWVSGGNVMIGYYNDPNMTTRVLHNGWLCTGDIAVWDENGFLKIKGRSDDLIIRAGMNIYPAEIEGVLKQDTRVKEVLVCGITDTEGVVRINMKIVGDFLDTEDVRCLCNELLPSYQIPNIIELVEELPKNGSGKIVRGGHYA